MLQLNFRETNLRHFHTFSRSQWPNGKFFEARLFGTRSLHRVMLRQLQSPEAHGPGQSVWQSADIGLVDPCRPNALESARKKGEMENTYIKIR
jgi:hypothetical protein